MDPGNLRPVLTPECIIPAENFRARLQNPSSLDVDKKARQRTMRLLNLQRSLHQLDGCFSGTAILEQYSVNLSCDWHID